MPGCLNFWEVPKVRRELRVVAGTEGGDRAVTRRLASLYKSRSHQVLRLCAATAVVCMTLVLLPAQLFSWELGAHQGHPQLSTGDVAGKATRSPAGKGFGCTINNSLFKIYLEATQPALAHLWLLKYVFPQPPLHSLSERAPEKCKVLPPSWGLEPAYTFIREPINKSPS